MLEIHLFFIMVEMIMMMRMTSMRVTNSLFNLLASSISTSNPFDSGSFASAVSAREFKYFQSVLHPLPE